MKSLITASLHTYPAKAGTAKEFPFLADLLDGWFHQDYSYEGESLNQIILGYRKAVSDHDRLQTAGDIERFLAKNRGSEQAVTDALEAAFHPEVIIEGWDGMTTKQWLVKVSELLTASIATVEDTSSNRTYVT